MQALRKVLDMALLGTHKPDPTVYHGPCGQHDYDDRVRLPSAALPLVLSC